MFRLAPVRHAEQVERCLQNECNLGLALDDAPESQLAPLVLIDPG